MMSMSLRPLSTLQVDSYKAPDVLPCEWMEDVLLRIPGNEHDRETHRELIPTSGRNLQTKVAFAVFTELYNNHNLEIK